MDRQNWQPDKIKKTHVLEAARVWRKRATKGNEEHPFFKHNFRQSTHFDVLVGGEPYPPKAIVSCAHGLATGKYLLTSEFAGADDGLWHRHLKKLGFEVVAKGYRNPTPDKQAKRLTASVEGDIEELMSAKGIHATEREALIAARIGQGKFREDVLERWEMSCAVTGCTILAAIRASHIKPWRESDNKERLDAENGLPLVATLDALFHRHLISFRSDGRIVISKTLGDDLGSIGINANMRLQGKLSRKQKDLLVEHRRKLV